MARDTCAQGQDPKARSARAPHQRARLAKCVAAMTIVSAAVLSAGGVAGALAAVGAPAAAKLSPSGSLGSGRCGSQVALPVASSGTSTPSSKGDSNSTKVAVVVPPVVEMVLSRSGAVVMAATNTGKAPSCSDDFMVFADPRRAHGVRADLQQVNALMATNLSGTWRPGILRPVD